jgi:hypothetical protein
VGFTRCREHLGVRAEFDQYRLRDTVVGLKVCKETWPKAWGSTVHSDARLYILCAPPNEGDALLLYALRDILRDKRLSTNSILVVEADPDTQTAFFEPLGFVVCASPTDAGNQLMRASVAQVFRSPVAQQLNEQHEPSNRCAE